MMKPLVGIEPIIYGQIGVKFPSPAFSIFLSETKKFDRRLKDYFLIKMH